MSVIAATPHSAIVTRDGLALCGVTGYVRCRMSGFVKLFGSILLSSIWKESAHTRLVWITLLALKDRDGVVEASVPGLADAARVTLEECQDALRVLSSPDQWSRNPTNEGRRIEAIQGGWQVLNHEYYRDKETQASRAEQSAKRQRDFRARQKEALRVTQPHNAVTQITHADPYTDPDPEREVVEPETRARAESSPPAAAAPAADHGKKPEKGNSSKNSNGFGDHGEPAMSAETVCPLDLVERAEKTGVLEELATSLRVPIESVRDSAAEFVQYNTIGKGIGTRRLHWMKELRGNVCRAARGGFLKAPGLLEHQRVSRETKTRHGGDYEQREAFDGKAEAARINAILRERKQKQGAA